MKKILFFNHASDYGGAGVSFLHLMEVFPREEYDLVVYCAGGDSPISKKLEEMNIRTIKAVGSPVSFAHFNGGSYSVFSKTFLNNVRRVFLDHKRCEWVIKAEKPDIVMVNSMTLFWIGKLAKKHGAKSICFHRETFAKGALGLRTSFIKKSLDNDFERVAFISQYDMQQTGLKKAEGFVITDKVDIKSYDRINEDQAKKSLQLDPNCIYGLFVGGFSRLKGFHVLMDAISGIQDPRVCILVVGCSKQDIENKGTQDEPLYQSYLRNKDLERLRFYPVTDQIQLFYKACDFVIFPATVAHQARPIYEAGAAGKPIVLSAFANLNEHLTEYEKTFIFTPNHSDMLATKINQLVLELHSPKVQEMVCQARTRAQEKYSLSSLRKELEGLLYGI